MTVTVCIPAYRAGRFIAETVQSILRQTHADLQLLVAIDPPDDGSPDDTLEALQPWLADPRLRVWGNPCRLGWAENFNQLAGEVSTPWFCFLPHDDVWAPTYLATMVDALAAQPRAIVAYGDLLRFGATVPSRKSVTLPPNADRATAVFQFLAQGTEAMMWRGVTRTDALRRVRGFPTDRHKGFAVECEYALALLAVGEVVHVPRTLYFKRVHEVGVASASLERLRVPPADRLAGWREHDRRMQSLLVAALDDIRASPAQRTLCQAAKEAALLRRYQQFVQPALGQSELARAVAALSACCEAAAEDHGTVRANLNLVLAEHWRACADPARAAAFHQAAWLAGSTYDSVMAHARSLEAQGRDLEALERATEAIRIGHRNDVEEACQLLARVSGKRGWQRQS